MLLTHQLLMLLTPVLAGRRAVHTHPWPANQMDTHSVTIRSIAPPALCRVSTASDLVAAVKNTACEHVVLTSSEPYVLKGRSLRAPGAIFREK